MNTSSPAGETGATVAGPVTPAVRFSLADLFRFVTVVAVLLGCIPLTGVPAVMLLGTMALALISGQGLIAIGLFMAALLGANAMAPRDWPAQLSLTLLLGIAVLGWYRWERHWRDSILARTKAKAKFRWQGTDCSLQ